MNVHIGLMIWKEMKQQGIPIATLAEKLGITKQRAQDIVNSASVDVSLLVRVSEALNYNFLSYYENGMFFSNAGLEEKRKSSEEIKRLKLLLSEKNKAIELKEKLIQNLSNTVTLLEKGKYS